MRQLTDTQAAEIASTRSNLSRTSRVTSPGAEEVLHTMLPVLDHGFVRLVDYMGGDESIPQAARMSYGKGTRTLSDDTGLIRYLLRHRHTTPFEMATAKFHVACPIFVARQWLRHRAGTFNEYSARYSVMEREFYIPQPGQLAAQSQDNKQGRAGILSGGESARVLEILQHDAARNYDHYLEMINVDENGETINEENDGLARELARMNLPVNVYTQFYWAVNLHNLLHFLKLRADPHAQYEIRIYAETIIDRIVKPWVPAVHEAFEDFSMGAVTLSKQGTALMNAALAAALKGEQVDPGLFGVRGRELKEVVSAFPALAPAIGR